MIDVVIDGKLKRVFELRKANGRLVYLDLKKLTRVDYNRILEVEAKGGDLLTEMRNTTADNGRNLLALIDSIIDVAIQEAGDPNRFYRLNKPGEPKPIIPEVEKSKEAPKQATDDVVKEAPKPAAKRRGRPPAKKSSE